MSTPSSNLAVKAQSKFMDILDQHFKKSGTIKADYQAKLSKIQDNKMTSDLAKEIEAKELRKEVVTQLADLRSKQDAAVENLRNEYLTIYRGVQPDDAGSVRLRREAMQDARNLPDREAMQHALDDAIHNNDPAMVHAIGHVSRGVFNDIYQAYAQHHPKVAAAAEAFSLVTELSTSSETNLANSITYSETSLD